MTGGIVIIYVYIAIWAVLALWWFRWKLAKVVVFAVSAMTLGLIWIISMCASTLAWIDEQGNRPLR